MTVNTKRRKVTHTSPTLSPKCQWIYFAPRAAIFKFQANLKTSVPSEPQMVLNTLRWKVPQISPRFTLRPAVFELQAMLRQNHQMTINDLEHWKVKIQNTGQLPPISKFNYVSVYGQPYSSYKSFWDKYTDPKWPQNEFEH